MAPLIEHTGTFGRTSVGILKAPGETTLSSSLSEQRERLRSILDGVAIAASELEARLGLVLSPVMPIAEQAQGNEVMPNESPLAAELRERADTADALQYQLRGLVARLEVE